VTLDDHLTELITQRDNAERERDALVAQLVALFGWRDASYLHATLHVENAVRNLQASIATCTCGTPK